ncbi:MAG: hypothetical protein C4541_10795 [Candidatus Auribacter fodinae]|jgi:glutathione synthase/RimK-type ligase-like ATP-grasp enzyme|uniref:ATP-grasp domain-containing protein n=1 Tax=Candidatus Auribacter fodinae TaxID=2093366 RepID=A0A3A4QT52_9BACT|nr:MAG: hypothetical protein C4541_10795 [Candidatus Auribacter fodinae]
MKIAVHYPDAIPVFSWAPNWVKALEEKGITVIKTDLRTPDCIDKIRDCDGIMWHVFHSPDDKHAALRILPAIENVLGIPVYPNYASRWFFDEKTAQHYLFKAAGLPAIPSWVFWNFDQAHAFLKSCNYPLVFKLSVGASSANVIKASNYKEAYELIISMFFKGRFPQVRLNEPQKLMPRRLKDIKLFLRRIYYAIPYIVKKQYPPLPPLQYQPEKNYVYFQEFMPDNTHDIRITVIGKRAFGFTRDNRTDDFRASGSGRICYDQSRIPLEAVKTAFEAARRCSFQTMAMDFLRGPSGTPLLNELSYGYLAEAVDNTPGYWDSNLNWHSARSRCEYLHVEDFIECIKTGKPSLL